MYAKTVVEGKRVLDRVICVKLEIEGELINVVSGFGTEIKEKKKFWSQLDEVRKVVSSS